MNLNNLFENTHGVAEQWSQKYKNSINCSHPKGFSQRAHCAGKKKHNESIEMEMVCEDCGMCQTHGNINEIKKGAKDSNGYTRCWPGKHAEGTKKGKNGGQVRNCVPNESQGVAEGSQRVDSLVTDALKIMRGAEVSDAVQALKTVLGDREFSSRRGHYNFYVRQLMDMYGQRGLAEGKDKRCMQCGMKNCRCPGDSCKCKPIAGWIPGKGFKKAIDEAANAAQQAAIAINMKKHHKKPKNKGVTEGLAQDEAEEYSGWRAEFVNQINFNTFEVKMTNTRSKESANFIVRPVDMISHGPTLAIETMDVHDLQTGRTESWTSDDPQPDGGIVYAISGMFYDNKELQKKLHNIVDNHPGGEDQLPGLDQRRSIGQEVDADDYIDSQEKTQAAMAKMKKAGKKPKNVNEFAPVGGDDREPNEEEILRQLAAQWWLGTEQQMAKAQRTLATMGWEIGQDESGDDDAGVFLIRPGDVNGDTYIAFNHSDLELHEDVVEASYRNYNDNRTGFRRPPREDDEGHEQDRRREQQEKFGTWYIRLNGKLIKDKQGMPYTYRGKAAANKAALTMQAKLFNQGKEFMLTTNPNDTQQGVEEGGILGFMSPEKRKSKKSTSLSSMRAEFEKEKTANVPNYTQSKDLPKNPQHVRTVRTAEASYINGKIEDPNSLRWKQTSMSYQEAVAKFGKDHVRMQTKNRLGDDIVEVLVPLGESRQSGYGRGYASYKSHK